MTTIENPQNKFSVCKQLEAELYVSNLVTCQPSFCQLTFNPFMRGVWTTSCLMQSSDSI